MVVSISVVKAAGSAAVSAYFLNEAGASYYSTEEPQCCWWGGAARSLGLQGKVQAQPFERLLAGCHPYEQRKLVSSVKWSKPAKPTHPTRRPSPDKRKELKKRRERCQGVDMTLSAPKSVSVVWLAGDTETRRSIERAMFQAAKMTLAFAELIIPLARRGFAGKQKELAKLVAALFLHTEARAATGAAHPDPQLHVHCVFPNVVQRSDGTYGAMDTFALHQIARSLGPVFRANLAHELVRSLGLKLYRPQKKSGELASWFEVEGIPQSVLKAFSSRRREIETAIEGAGGLDGSTGAARGAANLKTRRKKDKRIDREQLFAHWKEVARQRGLGQPEVDRLMGRATPEPFEAAYQTAWQATLKAITTEDATFTARKFIQFMCEAIQHLGVDGSRVARRVVRDLHRSPEIVPLRERREMQYTTREMLEIERQLLDAVDRLHAAKGPVVKDRAIEKITRLSTANWRLPGTRRLSDEQAQAAHDVLKQPGRIRVLSGAAGTGKSTTLAAVRRAFEKSGYRVIGGALSGTAAQELTNSANVSSRTVESYLYHLDDTYRGERRKNLVRQHVRGLLRAAVGKSTPAPEKVRLGKRHVLILDEASMIDTRTMAKLVKIVEKKGATIVLCGDERQLQAIGPGGAFGHIAKKLGSAKLLGNRRQQDARDRAAVDDLRYGDAAKALANYAQRGLVSVARDRAGATHELIASWKQHRGVQSPRDHLILTQTKAERDVINRRCQEARHRAGRLLPGLSVKKGDHRYYIGDRVRFHASICPGIVNGSCGRVIAVNPVLKQVTVVLDQAPTADARKKGARRTMKIPLRRLEDDAITLGYASTIHSAQGATAKFSHVLIGGELTHRELSYVAATRAKETTRFFVDESHAGPELKELAKRMSQTREKKLAHDVGRPSDREQKLGLSLERDPAGGPHG